MTVWMLTDVEGRPQMKGKRIVTHDSYALALSARFGDYRVIARAI